MDKKDSTKNIYVCTAIPYVNGAPHIGHVADYLLADAYAKYMKLRGKTVRFQAGTDEHGNKIERKAASLDMDVQAYVDENAAKFREFVDSLGVEYTDFIRTTDESHVHLVQKIWEKLSDHIYPHEYEGWYCAGCECFVSDTEYKDNNGICPDHQAPYEHLSEKNYYLRIADFKDRIREAIEKDELKILPDFRKKETLKLLEKSPDVSISRPKDHLTWGIPVPGDSSQVMYVWMDALSNYLTILGYPDEDVSDYWPANVQFVGKDILRFHAIIWPAMLLGLGLSLPKTIVSHGFILADGQKMSKSIGNVVDPIEAMERHGLDAFRYYFTRHIDTFADSDFTWEKFDHAYADELANDYGNLVQRLATLCQKNQVSGHRLGEAGHDVSEVDAAAGDVPRPVFAYVKDGEYESLMDSFELSKAVDYAWGEIQGINKHIEEQKPWSVAKDDPALAKQILSKLVGELLQANFLLKPFLPVAEKVEAIFTAADIVPPETPLFPKQ